MFTKERHILNVLSDREVVKDVFLPFWDEWSNELASVIAAGNIPGKVMAERYGCAPVAPYVLMFTAFCVGVEAALTEEEKYKGAQNGEYID